MRDIYPNYLSQVNQTKVNHYPFQRKRGRKLSERTNKDLKKIKFFCIDVPILTDVKARAGACVSAENRRYIESGFSKFPFHFSICQRGDIRQHIGLETYHEHPTHGEIDAINILLLIDLDRQKPPPKMLDAISEFYQHFISDKPVFELFEGIKNRDMETFFLAVANHRKVEGRGRVSANRASRFEAIWDQYMTGKQSLSNVSITDFKLLLKHITLL